MKRLLAPAVLMVSMAAAIGMGCATIFGIESGELDTSTDAAAGGNAGQSGSAGAGPGLCGNGFIEQGETCDPPDTCPTDCYDNDPCTVNKYSGSPGKCTARCDIEKISNCGPGDQCCPAGCNFGSDSDCSSTCGNGKQDQGETCDPPGTCPMSCDDVDPCTVDVMTGSPENCNVICNRNDVLGCYPDGCCAKGCTGSTDPDCSATGEVCDGVDNNSNGSIDEGDPGGGASCPTGKPECPNGTMHCRGVEGVQCVPDGAMPEICDGQDNDCDGMIDNIDFNSDLYNCGTCGKKCAAPNAVMKCNMGVCMIEQCTSMNMRDCDMKPETGCEIDTDFDATNCGACGNPCLGTYICTNAVCGCPVNYLDCGGTCYDVLNDPEHCGTCTGKCTAPQYCYMGACTG